MLKIAMICMLVATIIFALGKFLTKKNSPFAFLLQILSLISLICLSFVVANFKNDFSGYSILLILSIMPQFVSIFDLEEYLKRKKENLHQKEIQEDYVEIDNLAEQQNEINVDENNIDDAENQHKKAKTPKHYFLNSDGHLLVGVANILSAVCIGFCGLYLGIETYYGFLIGLAFAIALMFLLLIFKKNKNPYNILGWFFSFLAVGILLGQILTVILYSFALTNILYCVGAFIFAVFAIFNQYKKNNSAYIVYVLSMICLFSTIMF